MSLAAASIRALGAGLIEQRRQHSHPSLLLHFFAQWGGLGLLALAILDSSLLPTFGSLDVLLAFLSARNGEFWPYYAAMAALGSLIGSYLTYRVGRKTGLGWMESRVGQHRSRQVEYALEKWGFGALFVSTVAPPPFPTALFLLSAGAFQYDGRRFLAAVFSGRALRYGLLSAVAAHYGKTMVRYVRHPGEHMWFSLSVTLLLVLVTVLFVLLTKTMPERSAPQPQSPQSGVLAIR